MCDFYVFSFLLRFYFLCCLLTEFEICFLCLPSCIPSDMCLPHSMPGWAPVRGCDCRQIHLYGDSNKSTHAHTRTPNWPEACACPRCKSVDGKPTQTRIRSVYNNVRSKTSGHASVAQPHLYLLSAGFGSIGLILSPVEVQLVAEWIDYKNKGITWRTLKPFLDEPSAL